MRNAIKWAAIGAAGYFGSRWIVKYLQPKHSDLVVSANALADITAVMSLHAVVFAVCVHGNSTVRLFAWLVDGRTSDRSLQSIQPRWA